MLELTEGRAAAQLVLGPGGSACVLALHTDLLGAPVGPDADLFAAYEAGARRWRSVELALIRKTAPVARVSRPVRGQRRRATAAPVVRSC